MLLYVSDIFTLVQSITFKEFIRKPNERSALILKKIAAKFFKYQFDYYDISWWNTITTFTDDVIYSMVIVNSDNRILGYTLT